MWVIMTGEFMSIHFYGYGYLSNVSFLDCQITGQSFIENWVRTAVEVIYIFYSYAFVLYAVPLTSVTPNNNHGCHQKDIFFLFMMFKYIYLKSVHSGPKSNAIISHDWCDILGLYFAYSRMWRLSNYFEDKRMLETVGINSS